jgi:hypothetical protein
MRHIAKRDFGVSRGNPRRDVLMTTNDKDASSQA